MLECEGSPLAKRLFFKVSIEEKRNIKMKKISIQSFTIFSFYMLLVFYLPPHLDGSDCQRQLELYYNLEVFNPIFFILLLLTFFEIYHFKKAFKDNSLNILLLSPIVFHFIFLLFNAIRNLIIAWTI